VAATLIESISDTARWVAAYRALESERPDAIFKDPFARRLAGDRGEEIARQIRGGHSNAWALIVRTKVLDELIQAAVQAERVDAVVNLACGLDTRADRLAWPERLHWYDVDLPGILGYREEVLAQEKPACRREAVTLDLSDIAARQDFFRRIGAAHGRVLVITEGLLVYLTAAQVGSLAADLHAQPTFQLWALELVAPWILRWMQRLWRGELEKGNAPMQFGPSNGTAFFQAFGWREREFRSFIDESWRLHRPMPFGWAVQASLRFAPPRIRNHYHRMSGCVLLQRA
jgi:methyltransferase (TIGR00027 family)